MGDLNAELQALRGETAPTVVETEGGTSCVQLYSEEIADRITALYLEGRSLHKISQLAEMPTYGTILKWANENHVFRKSLEAARALRGIHFEDKAIEAAEAATCAEDTPPNRLRFDAYKWAAEVNDPTKYGKKVTHGGDVDRPIRIVVSTGFPEPNEFQRPPTLGADGLIIRKEKPVTAEVQDGTAEVRPGNREAAFEPGREVYASGGTEEPPAIASGSGGPELGSLFEHLQVGRGDDVRLRPLSAEAGESASEEIGESSPG